MLVEQKMKAHKGKFDAEWILKNLAKESIIARPTTVSSVVLDGEVLWCAMGYSRCSFAMPVWVDSKNEIPLPLRKLNAQGSDANELADTLKTLTRSTKLERKIDRIVRKAENKEFRIAEKEGHKPIAIYNAALNERYERFKEKCWKRLK